MINVDRLIDDLIKREGGYVHDISDRGGETNWGITIAQARAYGYTGAMRSLPRSTAATIYRSMYWEQPHFDHIANMMLLDVAEELFDTGVNMGPTRAAKFLQRALNGLNNNGKDYPDLVVDGQLGKLSFYALDKFRTKRGAQAEIVLMRMLESQQCVYYMELAEKDKSQEDFLFGWVSNRVGDVQ